jgi:hypothetical protein
MQWSPAHTIGLMLGFAVLGAALFVGRTHERHSYALFIATALLMSPIVHVHYFAVLLVVVALCSLRFDWLWAPPLLLWLSPQVSASAAAWRTALALAVAGATVAIAVRRRPSRLDRERPSVASGEAYA